MTETKKPELEVRICACGCKRTFKCWPTSPSKFYSKSCETAPEHRAQLKKLLERARLIGVFE